MFHKVLYVQAGESKETEAEGSDNDGASEQIY
jgi:hypothetical protein